MTLLGLDFDNTLVQYDKLFHQVALDKRLIDESILPNKTAVRDHLRSQGKEEQFTLLQGEVYGPRILDAEPAKNMFEVLKELSHRGIQMVLVSHKTRTPYKGPKHDLHKAAWSWLENHNFFAHNGLNWNRSQVFFEESKQAKIARIQELECTHYIDDLPEILEMLPRNIQAILFDPNNNYNHEQAIHLTEWKALPDILLG